MSIPDFTILVALDREHLAEFAVSYPTWVRHKPGLRERPMVIVHDESAPWREIEGVADSHRGRLKLACVGEMPGASQREKMLTALVRWGPEYVQTPFYLKVDSDCVATGIPDWILPEWFGTNPVLVSSPWGYSKPPDTLDRLDEWADQLPGFCGKPRPERTKLENRVLSRRIISYVMFGNTVWTRRMADLAGDRLPVASQDGFLWYCAARGGHPWVTAKMSRHGWRHVGGGGRRLEKAAREAMEMVPT